MSAFNRFLASLLFLSLAMVSAVFLLCRFLLDPHSLGLWWHVQGLLDEAIGQSRIAPYPWIGGGAGVFLISVLLLILEVWGSRPVPVLKLSEGPTGRTTLDIGAITDLVRWVGEETDGVEAMPGAAVRHNKGGLIVRARALLNPFVDAHTTARILEENLKTGVSRACGLPVRVQVRSRFQDPRARRKAK